MKKIVDLFFCIFFLTSSVMAQQIVQPSRTIASLDSGYVDIPQGVLPSIWFLGFDPGSSDSITITSVASSRDLASGQGFFFDLYRFKVFTLNLKTEAMQLVDEGEDVPATSQLVSDASSAVVDGKQRVLENADIPGHFIDLGLSFYIELDRAMESHNRSFIGGSLKNQLLEDRLGQRWHEIGLWERTSGKMLFQTQVAPEELKNQLRNEFFDNVAIGFSPNDRFFYLREFNQVTYRPDTHTTGIKMVNTETFELFPADKDVAFFTSDPRYYVTAVDEVPSLVSVRHKSVRQHYNIDGKIMTAAAVSPDDQFVYIATHLDEIYVFPSQLPTSHVEAWELSR